MKKLRAQHILIGFLAILAICTYFSATLSSLLAAKVTLCKPTSRVTEDLQFVTCIVPESALELEHELFIAVEEDDFWGKVLVAQAVIVEAEDLGDGEVSIISGLNGTENVIISWDRPLDTGMRVIEE